MRLKSIQCLHGVMDDSMIQQWCLNSLLCTQCIDQFIGIYIALPFRTEPFFFSYQKILINIEYAIDLMDNDC